jgi:hypothetical protein
MLKCQIPAGTPFLRYWPYVWEAAIYLLSRGTPPIWYSLRLNIDTDVMLCANKQQPIPEDFRFWEIERLPTGRPVIAWRSVSKGA